MEVVADGRTRAEGEGAGVEVVVDGRTRAEWEGAGVVVEVDDGEVVEEVADG